MNPPNEVNTNHGKSLIQEIYLIDPGAAQNDKLLEEIIGNSFGSASSSSTDPIIKVSEIAEKLISAPAMARSTYLVRGKFRMVDFHQSFHYVSCENCNKATGYDLGENFICYSCKNAAIARARCRVYLDVYDDTTSTPVVIFGSLAEEILGCTAVDLIDRTDEEHLPYIENIANNIENNEWIHSLGRADE
ncbi:hypothetical protein CIPAW_07G170300 [Carya illinoinensis]|uniref:Replication factor A C-terminal domain-containing protein n=1 Tax=Carya illinoinensis TaxID=32201 RepID=A0A8T1PW84_CARIL|nr:hypothetical protein CIPAW_07G170300 [Carya illinoinensis]